MIARLLDRFRRGPTRPPAPDHLIYAVGDIHGRRDLLERLAARIDSDAGDREAEIVFLGDYVDRGDDSAGVISYLAQNPRLRRFSRTYLKGNHEATLLDFLDDSAIGPQWARFGGLDTLASYKVRPPEAATPEAWERVRSDFAAALPASHKAFLTSLELSAERGCYLFVHAGVNPDRPLWDQDPDDLMWIRDAFLTDDRALERVIVHGHTPHDRPFMDRRRIGVDTGAYASGLLSAVRLDGEAVAFLSA